MLGNGNQFIPSEKASSVLKGNLSHRCAAPFSHSLCPSVSLSLSASLSLSHSILLSLHAYIFIVLYFKLPLTKLYSSVTNDRRHVPYVYQLSLSHDICCQKFCTPRPMYLHCLPISVYLHPCCAIIERWSQLSVKILCRNAIDRFVNC